MCTRRESGCVRLSWLGSVSNPRAIVCPLLQRRMKSEGERGEDSGRATRCSLALLAARGSFMLQQGECNNSAAERETWSVLRLADAKPPTKRDPTNHHPPWDQYRHLWKQRQLFARHLQRLTLLFRSSSPPSPYSQAGCFNRDTLVIRQASRLRR